MGLDTVELVFAVEDYFEITVSNAVAPTIFTVGDLHKYVVGLPGFVGDPAKSNEGILEAIQTAWHEEWEDAK